MSELIDLDPNTLPKWEEWRKVIAELRAARQEVEIYRAEVGRLRDRVRLEDHVAALKDLAAARERIAEREHLLDLFDTLDLEFVHNLTIGVTADGDYWMRLEDLMEHKSETVEGYCIRECLNKLLHKLGRTAPTTDKTEE